MLISGVVTQGARHTPDFVTQYRVGYSIDGQRWNIYKENGTDKVTICICKHVLNILGLLRIEATHVP